MSEETKKGPGRPPKVKTWACEMSNGTSYTIHKEEVKLAVEGKIARLALGESDTHRRRTSKDPLPVKVTEN